MAGAVVDIKVVGGASTSLNMGLARTEAHLNNVANAGKNAASAFRQMSLAGGFAEGAMFGAINKYATLAKTTAEFEERMSRAAALMGPANANLARMRDTVMTMEGMEHGPNALADAFLELSRAGIENGQALRDMKTVADLATVAQISLGEAANSTANVMLAWAGPLDTSTKLLDQLASVANATQFSIKSLMRQMQFATPAAIQYGESYRDMLASLAILAPVTGTDKAGRVYAQMKQNLANPQVVQLMSKTLGRNVAGDLTGGRQLDVFFDIASKLGKGGNTQEGWAIGKKLFSGIGARGMSAMFRAGERGITGDDGKLLYGKDALAHFRKMADGGMGLDVAGQASLIRESPGLVMQRLKVDWEKFLIGVGKPFLDLMVDLEKPLKSILKAGQAFGESPWAKVMMAVSAIPVIGAVATMLRAVATRTSVATATMFGIGGAGLGPVMAGTMVQRSLAQRMLGVQPAGFDPRSGTYVHGGANGFFGVAGDTLSRMFPTMPTRSYFMDPKRNPAVAAGHMRLAALDNTYDSMRRVNGGYYGKLRSEFEAGNVSRDDYHKQLRGLRQKGSLLRQGYNLERGAQLNSIATTRPNYSAGNIAGFVGTGLLSLGAGLLATLGPLGAFAALTYAAVDSMEQEQAIKDSQARNRSELTSFAQSMNVLVDWIKAQKDGKSFTPTEELTRLIQGDPNAVSFLGNVMYGVSAGGRKDYSKTEFAGAFAQRLEAFQRNVHNNPAAYSLNPQQEGDVSQNLLLAAYRAAEIKDDKVRFPGGLGFSRYVGGDQASPELRARIASRTLNNFAESPLGRDLAFNSPFIGQTAVERKATLAGLLEKQQKLQSDYKLASLLPNAFGVSDADITKLALNPDTMPTAFESFRGADGAISVKKELIKTERAINEIQASMDPASMLATRNLSLDGMASTLADRLVGSGRKNIIDALGELPEAIAVALLNKIVDKHTDDIVGGRVDAGMIGQSFANAIQQAAKSTASGR